MALSLSWLDERQDKRHASFWVKAFEGQCACHRIPVPAPVTGFMPDGGDPTSPRPEIKYDAGRNPLKT